MMMRMFKKKKSQQSQKKSIQKRKSQCKNILELLSNNVPI